MNRCNIRLRLAGMTTWVASIALLAAALSGCGAGQISQTANQKPAVNGNRLTINNVLLRDIRIQAVQTSDFIQPGKAVDLVLVAVNQSPDVSDRLVGITSDIGGRRRSTARIRDAFCRDAGRPDRGAGALAIQSSGQGDR